MIFRTKQLVGFVLLIVAITALMGWVIFELTVDDAKGEENLVKKVYYETALLIPIKQDVRLNVLYHHQEHNLSCEVAALLMALNYKGAKVTESELIDKLPVSDPRPRHVGNIWGNPDVGFVGNIDGTMPDTGYGVYEQPIYNLALNYRPSRIIASGTIADLIDELVSGNPVVVWGVIGHGRDISWVTLSGKVIKAKLDEHARTLIGFSGKSNNPDHLILLDPIYGEIRLKTSDFLKNWQLMDRRAVVVY